MDAHSAAEQLFFVTVRIDTVDNDNVQGAGTGFVFQHPAGEMNYPFIVTNKHVIEKANSGGITFIKARDEKPALGDHFRLHLEQFDSLWFGHPDPAIDIAIAPLAPMERFIEGLGVKIFYRAIGSDLIPTPLQMADIDAIEDIVFVGYPNGIWDQKNFLPIARRGTTATPIPVNFDGERKFLIDASVFGGSSGSPVFIYNTGTYGTKNGPAKVGTRVHFVGVVSAVFFRTELNELVSVPIPTATKPMALVKEMLDLGVVLKAETVVETAEAFVKKIGS